MQGIKTFSVAALLSFFAALLAGFAAIPFLKKLKAGQPVLKYVREHEKKNGTPTMGGLFFIPVAAAVFFGFLAALVCSPKDKS